MANLLPSSRASIPATSLGQDEQPRNRAGKLLRKRVKTGCLTCRKRRIKCGEQKPSCFNCIKSKRECDYNARLVFKDYPPLGEAIPPEFPADLDQPSFAPLSTAVSQQPFSQGDFAHFSAPLTPHTPSFVGQPVTTSLHDPGSASYPLQFANPQHFAPYPGPSGTPQWPPSLQFARNVPASGPIAPQTFAAINSGFGPQHTSRVLPSPQWQTQIQPHVVGQWQATTGPGSYTSAYERPLAAPVTSTELETPFQRALPGDNVTAQHSLHSPTATTTGSIDNFQPTATTQGSWLLQPDHNTVLEMAAVEIEDDDYYDVMPEEEAYGSASNTARTGPPIRRSSYALTTRSMPSYDTNMAFYNESQAASPLKNKATQSVFRHFIWHTAPSLSICERPAVWANRITPPTGMSGSPMSCWMDVLPSLAMQDPGLLHAMLAQSSYEIAKTSNASTTSSMRHHVWSLKRVHRALDSSKRRHSVTTLAATLLLGFYEILTADHMKWSTHLSGARHLIMETNFRGMTDEVRRRMRISSSNESHASPGDSFDRSLQDLCDIDDALVAQLMGFRVGPSPGQDWRHRYPNADLENYATRQDLFWWYCKQDVYHSMISGNDLLLPYHRWADCPPRASIGRFDAVYGSNDYLILLMGRIASFSANDRPRKLRAAKAKTPPPPSSTSVPPTPGTPGPSFYGMAPSAGQPQGHSAYGTDVIGNVPNDKHMQSTTAQVEALTANAMADWNEIRDACEAFVQRLGPQFQPLTEEQQPSVDTPFGRSCHFQSYEVAALWVMYYLSLIVLIRSHPSKPAAAHVSTGVSARETAVYANEIGRITASITSPGTQSDRYFRYRGACTACVVPLFFAGVQYQSQDQRRWTVERLLHIAKSSGWTTAETCANGCETSWVRAHEMGRGAPWQRMGQDVFSSDQRSSGKYIHLEGGQPVEPTDRRLLHYQPDSRLLWGFGLLGTIEDLGHITIND